MWGSPLTTIPALTLVNATSKGSADTKRKALPKWLREELEKMEKKRQKALEKEAQELSEQGREAGRPAWRDEESDHEEDEDLSAWKITPKSSSHYKSESPDDFVNVSLLSFAFVVHDGVDFWEGVRNEPCVVLLC